MALLRLDPVTAFTEFKPRPIGIKSININVTASYECDRMMRMSVPSDVLSLRCATFSDFTQLPVPRTF